MASRHVLPVETRGGGAVLGGAGKQKPGLVEGNNRRALIDVTNRGGGVVVEKPQPVNRPVTRSYCAQLLAKPQETVGDNKIDVVVDGPVPGKEGGAVGKIAVVVDGPVPGKEGGAVGKNQIAVVVDGPVPGKEGGAIGKAGAQKKVTVNWNPEMIIEISPDTKEEKVENCRQTRAGSSKKKVHTLTSILTARSKVACGLTNKPKEAIVDIDASDADNQLAAVEYVEDLYKFYKLTENSSRAHDYMDGQHDINEKMRAILVDWLIDVHTKFELMPETLYLTVHIVDRFLSMRSVSRKSLQLVGMSAMLIASKYEEIWAPEVNDFINISDNAYTREQILAMEKLILEKLEWTLTVPTLYVFLVRYIKAAVSNLQMENVTFFLAELSLMNYELTMYPPSIVAASAVYAARCTLKRTPVWDETLKRHTGFSESQLTDCAKLLVQFHSMAPKDKLQSVHKKYMSPLRGAVALLLPAKDLLA